MSVYTAYVGRPEPPVGYDPVVELLLTGWPRRGGM
jgi:hypothetical protein